VVAVQVEHLNLTVTLTINGLVAVAAVELAVFLHQL
jgi:hypothetical protein